MPSKTAILAIALCGAIFAPGAALAQNPFGGLQQNYNAEQARDARESGDVRITAQMARMIAESQYPGAEYLDLFLSGGDKPIYTVRLKTADGRRVEVVLDAQTGAVLRRS